ncbi:MAG: hypothetical protein ACI8TP_005211, partial [Acidimicrobiales bacterium]
MTDRSTPSSARTQVGDLDVGTPLFD